MIGFSIVVFFLISKWGESLLAPPPHSEIFQTESSHEDINLVLHVLIALAVIIIVARIIGSLFSLIRQPAVIGEVIGGILLGPSLLGHFAPQLATGLLPPEVAPFLSVIAQIGIILYMFLVGLELNLNAVYQSGHIPVIISHASIIFPFLLGLASALFLYPLTSTSDVPFTVYALFMGVSLSITAFPVLARILTDRNMHKTMIGSIALTCAAIDDATAWCLLAFIVSFAKARIGEALRTLALTIVFIFVILAVIQPLIKRLIPRLDVAAQISKGGLAIIFVAIIPSASRIADELTHRLQDVISVLFLPAFFAFSGMRTQIGLISGLQNWLICLGIIIIACIGKFGGTVIAARYAGLSFRDSSALGILMNTRGLVELIVLNIGLDLKVISPTLFTMLVIMALTTTFMTTPILHMIQGDRTRRDRMKGGKSLEFHLT